QVTSEACNSGSQNYVASLSTERETDTYQKDISEPEVQRFRTSSSFRGSDSSEDGRLQRLKASEAGNIRTASEAESFRSWKHQNF
ncbi:hypothetical protein A2U01_0082474, partial [Trifolium medium]|nr:hypothetical protein [Trifolium medium]